MTETQFIEENKDKWQELENLLSRKDKDPDQLHNLFVKVSSDLAYASTFYPKRSVRAYLNQLTQQVFDSMETKKTEWSLDGVKEFFGEILPSEMYRSRKALLVSFLVFVVALLIGIISSANNPEFVAVILGEDYVSMTQDNINNGDPMAVYKQSEQSDMFFHITINNVRVAFLCFILGLLGSLGTIIILLFNGIMVGAFQYYFYSKGLFVESFLTIWIHGTIEISAIIIAGSAGIVLGNGLLFPKTYKRATSLQISAKRAVRIIVGTIPLFIIAGFLESFITRLTDMPMIVKILIILISLIFILGMYVVYPWWYYRNTMIHTDKHEIVPDKVAPLDFERDKHRTFGDNFALSFSQLRSHIGLYFSHAIIPLSIAFIALISFYQSNISPHNGYVYGTEVLMDLEYGGYFMFFVFWFSITFGFMILNMIYREEELSLYNKLGHVKYYFLSMMLVTIIPTALVYFAQPAFIFVLFLFVPPLFFINMIHKTSEDGWKAWNEFGSILKSSYNNWIIHIVAFCIVMLLHFMMYRVIHSSIGQLIFDFFYWHEIFEGIYTTRVIILTIIYSLLHLFFFPLYYYMMLNFHYSDSAKLYATDLWTRFESFNTGSSIFENKV